MCPDNFNSPLFWVVSSATAFIINMIIVRYVFISMSHKSQNWCSKEWTYTHSIYHCGICIKIYSDTIFETFTIVSVSSVVKRKQLNGLYCIKNLLHCVITPPCLTLSSACTLTALYYQFKSIYIYCRKSKNTLLVDGSWQILFMKKRRTLAVAQFVAHYLI